MPTTNYVFLGQFAPGTYEPVMDPTGVLAANFITGEKHTVTTQEGTNFHIVVPLFAPFFEDRLTVTFKPRGSSTSRPLVKGTDYNMAYNFMGATRGCAKPVFGGLSLLNNRLEGEITLSYQTLGGNWTINETKIREILANQLHNPVTTSWEQIASTPTVFPVINHQWNLQDLVGANDVVQALNKISVNIAAASNASSNSSTPLNVTAHLANTSNPHNVTKAQVGLGNVEDFGVANASEAQNISITNKLVTPSALVSAVNAHTNATNPHPQYALASSVSFNGSFVGTANLIANTFTITNNSILTTSLFSIKFSSDNPAGVTLTVNGTTKPITDNLGNPIEAGEIKANQIRSLTYNGTSYSLTDITKNLYFQMPLAAFASVAQNDLVVLNNNALVKASSGLISTNKAIVGFADKSNEKVIYGGIFSGFTGLVVGQEYYLNINTPGAITNTKPNQSVVSVGVAKSSTELLININSVSEEQLPTGNNGDKIFFRGERVVTANYTTQEGRNELAIGPLEFATNVTVTLGDNSRLVIV